MRWVQQATRASTGLITHNNYWNTVISNAYTFQLPTWLGNLVLARACCTLTQTRNSDSRIRPAISVQRDGAGQSPASRPFGDNQFATPITLFPDLRNQDKYQVRYASEPRCGSATAASSSESILFTSRCSAARLPRRRAVSRLIRPIRLYINPPGPDCGGHHECIALFITRRPSPSAIRCPIRRPASLAHSLPRATAASRKTFKDLDSTPKTRWRVSYHLTVNYGLRYQTTFGLFHGFRTQPGRQCITFHCCHRWLSGSSAA